MLLNGSKKRNCFCRRRRDRHSLMQRVGFAVAVADATRDARRRSLGQNSGGHGACVKSRDNQGAGTLDELMPDHQGK